MSAKINDGGPAFPGFDYIDQDGKPNPPGMTLRDYFAAAALHVYVACNYSEPAKLAYKAADAMLAARERKEAQP